MSARVRWPVRVTIEGEAYHPDGADSTLILVRRDGGKIVLPAVAAGVTVEELTPPRTWTDGDVVQETSSDRVWRRLASDGGRIMWSNGFLASRSDWTVSARVARGEDRVLRYQVGESA